MALIIAKNFSNGIIMRTPEIQPQNNLNHFASSSVKALGRIVSTSAKSSLIGLSVGTILGVSLAANTVFLANHSEMRLEVKPFLFVMSIYGAIVYPVLGGALGLLAGSVIQATREVFNSRYPI